MTTTIGFRTASDGVRYAVVVCSNTAVSLLNASEETRLLYPARTTSIQDKLTWLYGELNQIWQDHSDTQSIAIKTNEFGLSDTKAKRHSYFAEGVIALYFARKSINVDVFTYSGLPANSRNVRQIAENFVDRTTTYWDVKMADAVLVAWKGIRSLP